MRSLRADRPIFVAPLPVNEKTQTETSGKAIASLVLGILGIAQVLPCIGPVFAIILGAGAKDGVGRAGVILGWITLALYALVAFLAILFLIVGGSISLLSMDR